jgi:hypothetical protein
MDEVGRFFARDERRKAGPVDIIVVSRTRLQRRPRLGGAGAGVQLSQTLYHTSDGRPVDPLDDGRFQIRGTDTILTRIDPNSPDQDASVRSVRGPRTRPGRRLRDQGQPAAGEHWRCRP